MGFKSILKVVGAGLILAVIGGSNAWAGEEAGFCSGGCPTVARQPATLALIALVNADPTLKKSLEDSIDLGQLINSDPITNPVGTTNTLGKLEDYYNFIDALVTYDPRDINAGSLRGDGLRISMDGDNYCNWNILDLISYSYFLVDRQLTTDPRGQIQFMDTAFSQWMSQLADAWGCYLETPASAQYVPNFVGDPAFGCDPTCWWQHQVSWSSFQEFFTRSLDLNTFPQNTRPVEGFADTTTVVSVGDSTSVGTWPISDDGKLVTGYDRVAEARVRLIKGKLYSDVPEFIRGTGPGETIISGFGADLSSSLFDNGTWTHQFLNVNNYHRLHIPIDGTLIYMRHIKAGTRLKSDWKQALPAEFGGPEPGYYDPRDTEDWQFGQTRLVLAIQTPAHGVVVVSAMGMAQVSGICLRDWVVPGQPAQKGWEFANFQFGGSDVVVIFEEQANFELTVPTEPSVLPGAGVNYMMSLQGEKYGCFGGVSTCSSVPPGPALPPLYPGFPGQRVCSSIGCP